MVFLTQAASFKASNSLNVRDDASLPSHAPGTAQFRSLLSIIEAKFLAWQPSVAHSTLSERLCFPRMTELGGGSSSQALLTYTVWAEPVYPVRFFALDWLVVRTRSVFLSHSVKIRMNLSSP